MIATAANENMRRIGWQAVADGEEFPHMYYDAKKLII